MTKVGKIIRQLRENKGWSQSRLARLSDVSNSYMNCIEMENEVADNIGLSTLERIANALGATLNDLFALAQVEGAERPQNKHVPILGFVNSSKQKRVIEWDRENNPVSYPIGEVRHTENYPDPHSYALIVKDDSMDPIKHEWIVIASPARPVQNNDLVVVEISGKMFLKKLQIKENMYMFYSTKNTQDPIFLSKKEIKILHKVCAVFCPELAAQ